MEFCMTSINKRRAQIKVKRSGQKHLFIVTYFPHQRERPALSGSFSLVGKSNVGVMRE